MMSEVNLNTSPTASHTVTLQRTDSQIMRLRLKKKKRNLKWSEEVVDNEGLGKKKSNKCCIYHKSRAFGESSSEESCSSDDDENDYEREPYKHKHQKHENENKNNDTSSSQLNQNNQ